MKDIKKELKIYIEENIPSKKKDRINPLAIPLGLGLGKKLKVYYMKMMKS